MLAALGVYRVLAYSVSLRKQEYSCYIHDGQEVINSYLFARDSTGNGRVHLCCELSR
jgi:hypothetical protein